MPLLPRAHSLCFGENRRGLGQVVDQNPQVAKKPLQHFTHGPPQPIAAKNNHTNPARLTSRQTFQNLLRPAGQKQSAHIASFLQQVKVDAEHVPEIFREQAAGHLRVSRLSDRLEMG